MKSINIKGKEYITVSERVKYFNENYLKGSITTELLSPLDSKQVVVKATVTPDVEVPTRVFTGYSQAIVGDGYINKTSALENAETSAVGRCLGLMGIGIIDSIASADEMVKAGADKPYKPTSDKAKHMATTRGIDADYSPKDADGQYQAGEPF